MVQFTCEVCAPHPNSTSTQYSTWLSHLLSPEHKISCNLEAGPSRQGLVIGGKFWTEVRNKSSVVILVIPNASTADPGDNEGITHQISKLILDYCAGAGLMVLNFVIDPEAHIHGRQGQGQAQRFVTIEFDDVISKPFIQKVNFEYTTFGSYQLDIGSGISVLVYPKWIQHFNHPHMLNQIRTAPIKRLIQILAPIGLEPKPKASIPSKEANNNSISVAGEKAQSMKVAPAQEKDRKNFNNTYSALIQVGSEVAAARNHMNSVPLPHPVARTRKLPKNTIVDPLARASVFKNYNMPQPPAANTGQFTVTNPGAPSPKSSDDLGPINTNVPKLNVLSDENTKGVPISEPKMAQNLDPSAAAQGPKISKSWGPNVGIPPFPIGTENSSQDMMNETINTEIVNSIASGRNEFVPLPTNPNPAPMLAPPSPMIFNVNPFLLPTPTPNLIANFTEPIEASPNQKAVTEDYFTLFDYFITTNPNRSLESSTRRVDGKYPKLKKSISAQKESRAKELQSQFLHLSPNQQLERFCSALTLTEEEIRVRCEVIEKIILHLRQTFPQIDLLPFGSFLTKLGGSDSDLDVLVDVFGTLRSQPGTNKDTIMKIASVLKKMRKPYSYDHVFHVTTILGARIPILKLTERTIHLSLDLSFENILSLQNSRLIAYYMDTYPIARPLTVFLRYWAKWHGVIGSFLIKNYALVLLVLTFLAKIKEIPSIHQLQNFGTPSTLLVTDWNAGFNTPSKSRLQDFDFSPCTWSRLLTTLRIFFQTYSTMDFETVVICSLLGEYIPRHQFTPGNENSLPPALHRYRSHPTQRKLQINTPLVIQDPFELSYNVSHLTNGSTLFLFRMACKQTLNVLEKTVNDDELRIFDLLGSLPKAIIQKQSYASQSIAKRLLVLIDEVGQNLLRNDDQSDRISNSSTCAQDGADSLMNSPDSELQLKVDQAISDLCSSIQFDQHLLLRVKSGATSMQDWTNLTQIGMENSGRRKSFVKVSLTKKFIDIFESQFGPNRREEAKYLFVDFVQDFLSNFWEVSLCNPGLERVYSGWKRNRERSEPPPQKIPDFPEANPNLEAKFLKIYERYTQSQIHGALYFLYTGKTSPNFWTARKAEYEKYLATQAKLTGFESKADRKKSGKSMLITKNAIEVDREITKLILEKMKSSKSMYNFAFSVWGKLETKFGIEGRVPELNLVFTSSKNASLCNQEGFHLMVKILDQSITHYLIFRLREFLGINEPPAADLLDTSIETEGSEDVDLEIEVENDNEVQN